MSEISFRQQFLLKSARDRRDWAYWLFEARKRFALCVLDYQEACNHVHLVVIDRGDGDAIAVGRRSFVERVQEGLDARASYRQVDDLDGVSVLREAPGAYTAISEGEMPTATTMSALQKEGG